MGLPEVRASLVFMVLGHPELHSKTLSKNIASFDVSIPPIRPQESEAAVFSLRLA